MDNLLNGECDGWTDPWETYEDTSLDDTENYMIFQELGGGYVWEE